MTFLLPFLAAKGSRVLEGKVYETEVSKTVFSHLKKTVKVLKPMTSKLEGSERHKSSDANKRLILFYDVVCAR